LKVFNGIKGVSMVIVIWGWSFFFAWFSIISNPNEVEEMRNNMWFTLVSMAIYTVPTFFFCSGFLQTFSFLNKNKEESMYTPKKLALYYLRKILRFVPLNFICMLAVMRIMPYVGYGPIWKNFAQLTAPCENLWWTNLVWINNVYPREFDDKCLPWTWFMPCYV